MNITELKKQVEEGRIPPSLDTIKGENRVIVRQLLQIIWEQQGALGELHSIIRDQLRGPGLVIHPPQRSEAEQKHFEQMHEQSLKTLERITG